MNFFKKKSKLFISVDRADMMSSPEDLIGLFRELNLELSGESQLVIKFNGLQDVSLSFLSVLLSFILLVERTHSNSILIQAEEELIKKIREANLSPLISKLATN